MRFQFIEAQKTGFPVAALCDVMQVSRSGFYAWSKRVPNARTCEDEALLKDIKSVFENSRKTYGSPRVHASLRKVGHRVSRLMCQSGLAARSSRKFRCTTTQSDPSNPVTQNTLDRNDTELTLSALDMALKTHRPPAGLLHHSDRGSNYTAAAYRAELSHRGIECSMSRRAKCWDNSVAESFFATIKMELIHHCQFETRLQAATAIFEYITAFYNRVRLHSVLGYTSPAEFKQLALVDALSA